MKSKIASRIRKSRWDSDFDHGGKSKPATIRCRRKLKAKVKRALNKYFPKDSDI